MAQIINFARAALHARASTSSLRSNLADKPAKVSADKPAAEATPVESIGFHHSDGILSLCHHLLTAEAEGGGTEVSPSEALMSDAMPSFEGQSSITSRNEASSDIAKPLGHTVLKSKAKTSYDHRSVIGHAVPMADRMTETEERLAFINRVKAARMAKFNSQKPMLVILELEQGTYKQYETRTPLPHRLIPKFCAATGVSMEWLLTGEGEGPRIEQFIKHVPKRRAVRGKKATRAA